MSINFNNSSISLRLTYQIGQSYNNMNSALAKIVSGDRLYRAAEGPADLIISEQMRSQIGELNQKIENTNNLIYKYEAASSYTMELRSKLSDLKTLAIQAGNEGFYDESALAAIQTEAEEVAASYNDIVTSSEYNSRNLFDGGEGSVANLSTIDLSNIDFSDLESVENSIATIDSQISEVDSALVDIGSYQKNELESELRSMMITRQNLIASESNLRSSDIVMEYTSFLIDSLKMKSSLAMLSHQISNGETLLNLLSSD